MEATTASKCVATDLAPLEPAQGPPRTCAHCGDSYPPKTAWQRFCRRQCRYDHFASRHPRVPSVTPATKHERPERRPSCHHARLDDQRWKVLTGLADAYGWSRADVIRLLIDSVSSPF